MKIKWRYFVPEISTIGLDLLELLEHITGVQNLLRQCRNHEPRHVLLYIWMGTLDIADHERFGLDK